ncbi:MAG TPA: glycosyltransferase family 87 protein [Vicinamibacterales bacterium]|nr:glycosyltransferase family 87 protein [Vicinamibacterales bacterium]
MTRIRILAACVILAAALGAFFLRVSRDMRDFEVPWTSGVRAAAAEPLYRAADEHYQFKYLPAFAVLAIPLGVLPLPVAKGVWFIALVALLIALIVLSVRLLPEQRKATAFLVVSAILVMAKFYARELDMGQVNLPFAVAATGALFAMKTGRELVAAALLVLTIAIKPYGALLLPVALVRRQPLTTVATGIGVLLLLVLPVPLYGLTGTIDLHRSWYRTITESTAPNLLNPDNISLASMYAKWLGIGTFAVVLATLTGLALAGGVMMVFLRRRSVSFPEGLEGSLLLLLIPLLSPQGWDYVLLIATPAIIYLANYLDTLPAPWRALTVAAALTTGLSLFDIMGRTAYAAFMGAGIISVCTLVLVGAISTLRLKAVA